VSGGKYLGFWKLKAETREESEGGDSREKIKLWGRH